MNEITGTTGGCTASIAAIVTALRNERARIDGCIETLTGTGTASAAVEVKDPSPAQNLPIVHLQPAEAPQAPAKRILSPAARKKISLAAKKRWAAEKASNVAAPATKKKRKTVARRKKVAAAAEVEPAKTMTAGG